MKGHLGVDSRSKLIHAVVATPANAADSTVLPDLLHGRETRVWGDQAYRGQRGVIRQHAPKAQDFRVVDEVERAKIEPSRKCAPGSNLPSESQSGRLASPRCAIAG
jgi:IS5 family transposase